jgi:hypothetical protein
VPRTLTNTTLDGAKKKIPDLEVFGGDDWKLLNKASSEEEGWMKTTKAYEIPGVGCLVQCETMQRNGDSVQIATIDQADENVIKSFRDRAEAEGGKLVNERKYEHSYIKGQAQSPFSPPSNHPEMQGEKVTTTLVELTFAHKGQWWALSGGDPTFVPGVRIDTQYDADGKTVISRKLVKIDS